MAGRPLRRLKEQAITPFADWLPPKPRYVALDGSAAVPEAPHPAFMSQKHGIVVVWDVIDDYGDVVEYEPNAVAVQEGGEYLFSGLQGLAAFHDEDSRKPYSVILPTGATYAEVLSLILSALDEYPTASQMQPVLFEALHKPKGRYGFLTLKWGMAPSKWLRVRGQKKNPKRPAIKYTGDWLDLANAYGVLIPDEGSRGYNAAVMRLAEVLEKNKSTTYPEISAWVDKLVVEAQGLGGEERLFRSIQQKFRTSGPGGVSAVAQNITRLWL